MDRKITESTDRQEYSIHLTGQFVIVKKLNGICLSKSWHPHLHTW